MRKETLRWLLNNLHSFSERDKFNEILLLMLIQEKITFCLVDTENGTIWHPSSRNRDATLVETQIVPCDTDVLNRLWMERTLLLRSRGVHKDSRLLLNALMMARSAEPKPDVTRYAMDRNHIARKCYVVVNADKSISNYTAVPIESED